MNFIFSLDAFSWKTMQRTIQGTMTNELALREVQEGDLPIFFEQQLDPEATRMAAFPSRALDAFTEHWAKGMAEKTSILKTILFRGEVAGNIVYWEQSGEKQGRLLARERVLGQGHCQRGVIPVSGSGESAPLVCACREAQYRLDPGPREMRIHRFRRGQVL